MDSEKLTAGQLSEPTGASLVGFQQAGAGAATDITVQSKLQETVSVKDFGAVGNGATDDTAAIKAMIESGAVCWHFPPGEYILDTNRITMPNVSWSMIGPGDGLSAIIKQKPGTLSGWFFNATFNIGKPKLVRGLGFVGTELPSSPRNIGAFKLGNTNGIYFENCWFRSLSDGIGSENGNATSSLVSVRGCTFQSCTRAIDIVRGDACVFSDLVFYGNGNDLNVSSRADGLEAGQTGNSTVISNIDTMHSVSCVRLKGLKNFSVSNVSADYLNVGYPVPGSYAVFLDGCEDGNVINVSTKGDTNNNAGGALGIIGSRINATNISSSNSAYVVNCVGDQSNVTNITGKAITQYGVFGQDAQNCVFSNIVIDGCVNGVYLYLSDKTAINRLKVINNSGDPIAVSSTAYVSVDESYCHNLRVAIVSGLKVFNTRGDNSCVTYRNSIPADVINPFDTVNRLGSLAYNIAPTAGGYLGWVCVGEGAPGVWKAFGAILP